MILFRTHFYIEVLPSFKNIMEIISLYFCEFIIRITVNYSTNKEGSTWIMEDNPFPRYLKPADSWRLFILPYSWSEHEGNLTNPSDIPPRQWELCEGKCLPWESQRICQMLQHGEAFPSCPIPAILYYQMPYWVFPQALTEAIEFDLIIQVQN